MTNRFIKNKEIIDYAKNYYSIISEEFNAEDNISEKLIELYKDYIFSFKSLTDSVIKKIEKIDKIIFKYFNDFEFKKELSKGIINIKIKKDEVNLLECIINNIFIIFDKYVESYTRNIYIPKCI